MPNSTSRAYGFRLKIYDLTREHDFDPKAFLKRLTKRGYRIIFLYRENVLQQSLSNFKANHSGQYHATTDRDHRLSSPVVSIDYDELIHYMRSHQQMLETERKLILAHDTCDLQYERDLRSATSHQATIDKVSNFLNLPPVKLSAPPPIKKDPTGPEEWIENWPELKARLEDSEFARYLY